MKLQVKPAVSAAAVARQVARYDAKNDDDQTVASVEARVSELEERYTEMIDEYD